ncbi:unnamed protein product [Arctogadus glacialis]
MANKRDKTKKMKHDNEAVGIWHGTLLRLHRPDDVDVCAGRRCRANRSTSGLFDARIDHDVSRWRDVVEFALLAGIRQSIRNTLARESRRPEHEPKSTRDARRETRKDKKRARREQKASRQRERSALGRRKGRDGAESERALLRERRDNTRDRLSSPALSCLRSSSALRHGCHATSESPPHLSLPSPPTHSRPTTSSLSAAVSFVALYVFLQSSLGFTLTLRI